jgi:hypothetical protein
MLPIEKLSVLAAMREHFTQQGWPAADLDRFRMEASDDSGDDDASDDQDDDAGDDNGDDEGDADKLGDAGKKALDRMKTQRNAERDKRKGFEQILAKHGVAADKLDELLAAAKKKPGGNEDDDGPTAEQIRAEARREARLESAKERAADKVEVRAAAKFDDPEVVAALLSKQLDDFIDSDGKIDVDAIDEALEELLEKKPHLAKPEGDKRRFRGDADQGARGKDKKPPATLGDAIAEELKAQKRK